MCMMIIFILIGILSCVKHIDINIRNKIITLVVTLNLIYYVKK